MVFVLGAALVLVIFLGMRSNAVNGVPGSEPGAEGTSNGTRIDGAEMAPKQDLQPFTKPPALGANDILSPAMSNGNPAINRIQLQRLDAQGGLAKSGINQVGRDILIKRTKIGTVTNPVADSVQTSNTPATQTQPSRTSFQPSGLGNNRRKL